MKIKRKKTTKFLIAIVALSAVYISSCSESVIHNGRIPFSLMEKAPSERSAKRKLNGDIQKMKKIITYHADKNKGELKQHKREIKNGDVIAFYMSHKEAGKYLKKAKIQKVPYELFRYGHLAVVVPNSRDSKDSNKRKLLQLAMKQVANIDDDLSYLDDKNWVVYRPSSIDEKKLTEFTHSVVTKCSSPNKAYDYSGAFGIKNAKHKPTNESEIATEYTCCTLVVAALNYAGYELHSTHRGGILDIVTPRQVVDSWGISVIKSD